MALIVLHGMRSIIQIHLMKLKCSYNNAMVLNYFEFIYLNLYTDINTRRGQQLNSGLHGERKCSAFLRKYHLEFHNNFILHSSDGGLAH